MTNEEIIARNRRRVERSIKDYNENLENQFKTMDEVEEELEEKVIEYLKDNPKVAKRVVEMFTPKKEKEENKDNRRFRRFAPLIIAGGLVLGALGGAWYQGTRDKNTNIQASKSYEKTYELIDEAPLEVKVAYVENQMKKYSDAVNENPNLANPEFEETFRNFESAIHGGSVDASKSDDLAQSVSKITGSDYISDTLPFEYTEFSRSIVKDGEVFVPVKDSSELAENQDLLSQDGSLYRKGR